MNRSIVAALALSLATAPFAVAGSANMTASAPKTIVDVAAGAGSFTTLTTALKAAGLDQALRGDGPFTVFAPTDEAFAKLPAGTVEALLKDIPKLKAVLLNHVVVGNVTSTQVVGLTSAKTLGGGELSVKTEGGAVHIDNAKVVKADVLAANGVIHVIDTVLVPAS